MVVLDIDVVVDLGIVKRRFGVLVAVCFEGPRVEVRGDADSVSSDLIAPHQSYTLFKLAILGHE